MNYYKPFAHLYVERSAFHYPLTQQVMNKFKEAKIIPIGHYKDVFNRAEQNPSIQNHFPKIILAVNDHKKVYPASSLCQNFDYEHFYFVSPVLNCLYDCSYCYLKGMYNTKNVVIFVNTTDFFNEINHLPKKSLVSLSYENDLISIHTLTDILKIWSKLIKDTPHIDYELRTKSGATHYMDEIQAPNVTLSFSILPQRVITQYESKTPSLNARINAINQSIKKGIRTRLCIDPLLPTKQFEQDYRPLIQTLKDEVDLKKISDISIGGFRMPIDYFKNMRRNHGNHSIHYDAFDVKDKTVFLPLEQEAYMIQWIKEQLPNCIFFERQSNEQTI